MSMLPPIQTKTTGTKFQQFRLRFTSSKISGSSETPNLFTTFPNISPPWMTASAAIVKISQAETSSFVNPTRQPIWLIVSASEFKNLH